MEIVISPRLARGLSLLSAYQQPPRKNVVANFNFIANFADALISVFLLFFILQNFTTAAL